MCHSCFNISKHCLFLRHYFCFVYIYLSVPLCGTVFHIFKFSWIIHLWFSLTSLWTLIWFNPTTTLHLISSLLHLSHCSRYMRGNALCLRHMCRTLWVSRNVWKPAVRLFLGMVSNCGKVADASPGNNTCGPRKQHVWACRCFCLFLGFESVAYRKIASCTCKLCNAHLVKRIVESFAKLLSNLYIELGTWLIVVNTQKERKIRLFFYRIRTSMFARVKRWTIN